MRWRSQIKCIGIATLLIGSTIIALTVWSTEEVWAASSSSLPLLTRLVAPTPTPTPTPSQPGIFSVIDPNIVGTIFGVLGTLGTFIAIGISNRQHRETQQAEQKRQEAEERRQEDQKKHQRELVDVQKQHQI